MKTPLVTVVIPTYNRAGIICRTIDNVLAQTYSSIELVVVDDGSTDNTQERLRRYGDRLRVIVQSNAGPSVARNRGLAAARGEFIAFQDSDDLWAPTKLERQITLLQRLDESVVCCVCDTIRRYTDRPEITDFKKAWLYPSCGEGIWANAAEVLATRFVFFCQTATVRRSVLERVGGFNETLKYHEDHELPLRVALAGPWAFIRDPLAIWNQGASNSWSQKALSDEVEMRDCEVRMRRSILARIKTEDTHSALRRLLQWELGRNYFELWLAKFARTQFPMASVLASAVKRVLRYVWAVYRRSPWYPMFEAKMAGMAPGTLPQNQTAIKMLPLGR